MSYFSCLCFSASVFPLFPPPKKIDEENEANLLAVLTETLDSIPVDEDGLPSFEALADGDVTNASDRSCPSSPDGSPRTPEPEEPSLVRSSHHHRTRVRHYHQPPTHAVAVLPVHGRHQIRFFNKAGHQKCPFVCQTFGFGSAQSTLCHICHNVVTVFVVRAFRDADAGRGRSKWN